MFLSCHWTIANYDHIIDMLENKLGDYIVIDDLEIHRSKCTNIIENVLCPNFEDLKRDIGIN